MNVTFVACAIILIASSVAGLKLQLTNNMRRIYTDSGTGAKLDLAVFEPNLPQDYYLVGHFAQRNHDLEPNGFVVISCQARQPE